MTAKDKLTKPLAEALVALSDAKEKVQVCTQISSEWERWKDDRYAIDKLIRIAAQIDSASESLAAMIEEIKEG